MRQVLVVDCDVHQGDGTARIFEHEPRVFTFSMQGERNYPVRRAVSDLDIELPDGTTDAPYLARLAAALPGLVDQVKPDLVFYIAGVDPHADDRLGRLSLSDEGLATRDAYVLAQCLPRAPVVGVIGGGYDRDIEALAKRHATLHRAAVTAWREGVAPSRDLGRGKIPTASLGLILSLSKDKAAPPPCVASSFDRLRMRRMKGRCGWEGSTARTSGTSAAWG